MDKMLAGKLLERRYREVFSARVVPAFDTYLHRASENDRQALIGYRRADAGTLFLETYLDEPIEAAVSRACGRACSREQIVELGNFAADSAPLMLELWGGAANDLGGTSDIAVATLTAPLRRIFARIGVEITVLAPARAERLGEQADQWGSYYAQDPQVCSGDIAAGQAAIAAWRKKHAGTSA